ncbi:MAG: hypothetical protein GY841_19190 [FCB group bacterium]|nr:hypothetical protein [FCB group bacterium]
MRMSEKKLAANRQNAQKSTGPKTPEGKQIVSQNGVKHGLYTQALILNAPALKDDPAAYESLIASLIEDLQPEGIFENFLVRKIANCLWRSRRAIDAENAQIERQLKNIDSDVASDFEFRRSFHPEEDDPTPEEIIRAKAIKIGSNSIPEKDAGHHIMRYEMRLDRQLSRAFFLLERLQSRRKSEFGKQSTPGSPILSNQTQISCNQPNDRPLEE